jgi:hypothetical protein
MTKKKQKMLHYNSEGIQLCVRKRLIKSHKRLRNFENILL